MRPGTRSALDDYYAQRFGIDRRELWRGVTVRPHGSRWRDSPGYYVVWRGDGVHVSAPSSQDSGVLGGLEAGSVEDMQTLDFWQAFAARQSLRLSGPGVHAYLDADPGPPEGVVRAVTPEALDSLRRRVDEQDWVESGWDDQPPRVFGAHEDGVLVAASNLNPFHGQPRDVGVLVDPRWRGRGLSVLVGRRAASWAIREHGFAKWSARTDNTPSVAASRRLGFEPWCSSVAIC